MILSPSRQVSRQHECCHCHCNNEPKARISLPSLELDAHVLSRAFPPKGKHSPSLGNVHCVTTSLDGTQAESSKRGKGAGAERGVGAGKEGREEEVRGKEEEAVIATQASS